MSALDGITAFDVAIGVVVLLSTVLALARGFVREVVSVASWVGAGVVAWLAYPEARPIAIQVVDHPLLTDVLTAAVVFLVPLIVFRVVGGMLADAVSGTGLGLVDRLLGVAFGAARGAAIVCIAYLLGTLVLGRDGLPAWVTAARLEPQVRAGAEWLGGLLPEGTAARGRTAVEGAVQRAQQGRADDPAAGPNEGQGGYGREPREQMNRLLDQLPR